MKIMTNDKAPSIRELYPTLSEEELKQAEANLKRYFEIAFEICGDDRSGSIDTPIDSTRASPKIEERSSAILKN
jgi:hypothetical protein